MFVFRFTTPLFLQNMNAKLWCSSNGIHYRLIRKYIISFFSLSTLNFRTTLIIIIWIEQSHKKKKNSKWKLIKLKYLLHTVITFHYFIYFYIHTNIDKRKSKRINENENNSYIFVFILYCGWSESEKRTIKQNNLYANQCQNETTSIWGEQLRHCKTNPWQFATKLWIWKQAICPKLITTQQRAWMMFNVTERKCFHYANDKINTKCWVDFPPFYHSQFVFFFFAPWLRLSHSRAHTFYISVSIFLPFKFRLTMRWNEMYDAKTIWSHQIRIPFKLCWKTPTRWQKIGKNKKKKKKPLNNQIA